MRFLHTGDLHLDSAFCASSETEAQRRRAHQRETLRKIFSLAQRESCDMMLIAGDLFDSLFVRPETERLCFELFESFKKPIVISPGNHDPYVEGGFYSRRGMPENVFVFTSSELQYFDFPNLGVSVAGYAFTSAAYSRAPLEGGVRDRKESERVLLLCAHADVNVPSSRYAPILESELFASEIDYAALGHVHSPDRDFLDGRARYCGFPEGRGFDECGEGGVYIVDVDELGEVSVERRSVSDIRYIDEEISLDGARTVDQMLERIRDGIKGASQSSFVRVTLVGAAEAEMLGELCGREAELGEGLGSFELRSRAISALDGDYLEKDQTLRGELYRTLRPMLYSDDSGQRARAAKALEIGLAAIDGRGFADIGGDK